MGVHKVFGYLAAANDTVSFGANAKLHKVVVGTGVATAVVTVYNGTTTSDPVIATIDAASAGSHHFDGVRCSAGLFVKLTTAAAKVTVIAE